MSPEMIAIIGVGVALAALIVVLMIFSELDSLGKRIDRLEGRFENRIEALKRSNESPMPPVAPGDQRSGESFTPPSASVDQPNASLAQRVAYLEGLMEGGTGKSPFDETER